MAQKQITRAVAPEELSDLLSATRWASLALIDDGRLSALAIRFVYDRGRYFVGVRDDDRLAAGARVSLLIDDGVYHTELRGVRVQGTIGGSTAPPRAESGRAWLEVIPNRVSAWHYGAMRRRER